MRSKLKNVQRVGTNFFWSESPPRSVTVRQDFPLDFARCRAQSMPRCSLFHKIFTPVGARNATSLPALREHESSPPEILLQAVWRHQRLLREQLATLDGRTVRILHPGFLNREGGPDFRGAVVQFGEEPPRTGDVEVDIEVRRLARARARSESRISRMSFCTSFGRASAGVRPPRRLRRRVRHLRKTGCAAGGIESVAEFGRIGIAAGKFARPMLRAAGANFRRKNCASCCCRRRKSVFTAKPRNSRRARGRPAGSKRCGKACFARSATNTMCGRCNASPKVARAGSRRAVRRWRCRRGCSGWRACCRRNSPARRPARMVTCARVGPLVA